MGGRGDDDGQAGDGGPGDGPRQAPGEREGPGGEGRAAVGAAGAAPCGSRRL